MNNKQNAQINMFTIVALFYTKYMDTLKTYLPLMELITDFFARQKELKTILQQQGIGTTGVKDDKNALRLTMINLIVPLALKAHGWALTNGTAVLTALFNVSADDFMGNEKDAVTLANNIVEAIGKISVTDAAKYNITVAKTAETTLAISSFSNAIGSPKQQRIVVKDATILIEQKIKEIEELFVTGDSLLDGEFWDNTELRTEYQLGRRIGTSVRQHTTIKVSAYSDAAHTIPVYPGTIAIDSLVRDEVLNADGMGEIVQFKGGSYMMNVKAPGFVDESVPFVVKHGKHSEMTLVMTPKILQVLVTDKSIPAGNYDVRISNHNITGVTGDKGVVELSTIPNKGTVEVSSANGVFLTQEYDMGSLSKLIIEVKVPNA